MQTTEVLYHPFDIVKRNVSPHNHYCNDYILIATVVVIFYYTVKLVSTRRKAIVFSFSMGMILYMAHLAYVRKIYHLSASSSGNFTVLNCETTRLSNQVDNVFFTFLPLAMRALELTSIFMHQKTRECNKTKPVGIQTFLQFFDTTRIYCPSDYTIPARQLLSMNHVSYHPSGNEKMLKIIKDSLSFFHLTRPDHRLSVLSFFGGSYREHLWNNHAIPKTMEKGRREAFNNYGDMVGKWADNKEPLSVVIFSTGHIGQNCSIYHANKLFDGIVAISLFTGVPIVPVFNAYYIANNKEHFRQIISKPVFVNRCNEPSFDMEIMKTKHRQAMAHLHARLEQCYKAMSKELKNMHKLNDGDLETEWAVDSTNINCVSCSQS